MTHGRCWGVLALELSIILAACAQGQLMTFTVVPQGRQAGESGGARTQSVISSHAIGRYPAPAADLPRIRPSPPKVSHHGKQARSDLLGVQITDAYAAVAAKSGSSGRGSSMASVSSTTESVIHFLDRIRQLPPDENPRPPLVSASTTESVIELLNKLRQRVTPENPRRTFSTSTSPSIPTTMDPTTNRALPDPSPADPILPSRSTSPDSLSGNTISTVNSEVTENETESHYLDTSTDESEDEWVTTVSTVSTTDMVFEETFNPLTDEFANVPKPVQNYVDDNANSSEAVEPAETATSSVLLDTPLNVRVEFPTELWIPVEDTTFIMEMNGLPVPSTPISTESSTESTSELTPDLTAPSPSKDFLEETNSGGNLSQTSPLGPSGLDSFKDLSSNTSSSENPIQEWKVAIISSIVVLLTVLVLAVVITLCVCRNTIHRKNVYTTMETQAPQFFTQPGPPVILQHEIEAVQNPRAAFAASSQKITEL